MHKLAIGIIGAGSIVESNHLPAISMLDQAEVKWIFDKNSYRMDLVSAMYGVPGLQGRSVEKAMEEIDICLLAIPYGVRKYYIEICRKLGKAVVVEKPFAFSRQEHEEYCNGFKECQIGLNFQRRFYQSVSCLRKIIDTNIFGDLFSLKLIHGNFSLKGGSGYLSDKAMAGGGVIAESAIHALDIVLNITGASDAEVKKMHALHYNGLDYDSVFETEIRTKKRRIPVHCEISTLRNLENGLFLDFENAFVSCDLSPDGKIFVHNKKMNSLDFHLSEEQLFHDIFRQAIKVNQAFFIFWEQFLLGLQNNTPNMTSAFGSIVTSSWIENIYRRMELL
jgi:predicted dehydrogenase